MDNTNQITLTYLSNPLYSSCGSHNRNSNVDEVSQDEVRFYKKRLYALSRDMLRGKCDGINEEVKKAHDVFVRSAIDYLKMMDTEEILQNEYKNMEQKQMSLDTCPDFDMNDVNNTLFPSRQEVSTLDGYVNSKKVSVREQQKHPQRIRLNLRAENLRLKGIKTKEKKM